MISTITTSTVSLIASGAVANTLAAIGIVLLLSFLVQKELASVAGSRFQRLAKLLNVGIAPLLITFALFVIAKVVEVIL